MKEFGENPPYRDEDLPPLDMYGGPWMALIPTIIFIVVLVWLSVLERASISGFLVGGWLALAIGMLLAKNRRQFSDAVIRGLSDRTGVVVIAAFIFAGVFGALLSNSGLVDGLLWIGLELGVTGAAFVSLAFILTCIFATGVGTSVGTYLAVLPILYPAGVALGADPTMLAVAILAGGSFGDNLAPISDSTISSAYTAQAEMGDVVRSRLPLTLVSAAGSLIVFALFGGGGEITHTPDEASIGPLGLIMLIPFIVVVGLAMARRHIITALIWGSIVGIIIGVITGLMSPMELFSIPEKRGGSTGIIEDGITGVYAPVIFVLFILAVAQLLKESGLMGIILSSLEKVAAKDVKGTELSIFGITLLFTVPLGANAPAILLVGPTIGRPLGIRQNLAPARIANLMDCAANTIFYVLPWHNAVIVWYSTLLIISDRHDIFAPSIATAALNPYAWILIVVMLFSIFTGWNRKFATPQANA